MKAAVIGAGWAGLAASVALREAGATVTVFEASHTPGGRARRVCHSAFEAPLDNGQHILSGAYRHTLALMRRIGRNPDLLFMRRPFCLASLDGRFRLSTSNLPAPLHLITTLFSARGLSWSERYALLRLVRGLKKMAWLPPRDWTVRQLLLHYSQPDALIQQLWEPLCLAALNTPVGVASARLYARVLRDSLNSTRAASHLLFPCTDLSDLWADFAARQVTMRYGNTVRQLIPAQHGVEVNQEHFDCAVLAAPPIVAARLLATPLEQAGARGVLDALNAFDYLPIATLYLRLVSPWALPEPMMLLRENIQRHHRGQWLFDRARLMGTQNTGELAIVISAAIDLDTDNRAALISALIEQISEQAARHPARLPPMPSVQAAELVIEKRATFTAVPDMTRPLNTTPWPTLALAGDWTDTGYPGVLEGAVMSGLNAAKVLNPRRGPETIKPDGA